MITVFEDPRRRTVTLASVDANNAEELAELYLEMYREMLRDALEDDPDIAEIERLWLEARARADRAARGSPGT